MRVVIVCDPGRVDGGAAKIAIAGARGLAEAGVSVHYVCSFGPTAADLSHPNIQVHCLDMPSVWNVTNPIAAATQGIWNKRARREFENILRQIPHENTVVHFHQWTKSFSPSVLSVPAQLGIPAIAYVHDYFLACPTGAYYRFADAAPCTLIPMSGACLMSRCDSRSSLHKAVRVARQMTTSKALEQAGASLSLVSNSPFGERVVDDFISREHRRFVVPYPVVVPHDSPVPVTRNKQFVFLGRMTEEKGVRQLARAAREANLPVTFVGEGPLLDEIRAQGDPVRCTGWQDSAGVNRILQEARALVFPSTWYETGGLVVPEALGRGIPVLVSRETGAADFIVDGENGFLLDRDDGHSLRARMHQLADDAIAERMGRQAYERYWGNPQTEAVHARNLMRVYEDLLLNHRRPAEVA